MCRSELVVKKKVDRVEAQNFVRLLEQNKNSLLFTEDCHCISCYGTYHHSAGLCLGDWKDTTKENILITLTLVSE